VSLGVHKTNATLAAPEFGHYDLLVTDLGFGKSVVTQPEGESRRYKTFYPQVATSGEWYIQTVFTSHRAMSDFSFWLISYYNKIIDPNGVPLLPMTVSVRSRDFRKVGYPVTAVDFGDRFGQVIYPMKINFVSASEPTVTAAKASKYAPPLRESAVGATMAPGGLQVGGFTPSPYTVGSPLTGYRS
jgi:hypothetical protein